MRPALSYGEAGASLRGIATVLDRSVSRGPVEADGDSPNCVNQSSKAVKVDFYEVLEPNVEVGFNCFYESCCSGLGR